MIIVTEHAQNIYKVIADKTYAQKGNGKKCAWVKDEIREKNLWKNVFQINQLKTQFFIEQVLFFQICQLNFCNVCSQSKYK